MAFKSNDCMELICRAERDMPLDILFSVVGENAGVVPKILSEGSGVSNL